MSAYTKGPWEVRRSPTCHTVRTTGDFGAGGRQVCSVPKPNNPESIANARLIAAAPELLEALKLAGNLFAANHAISQFDWGKSALRAEDIRELNEVPLAICAAINKAEGKS